MASFLYDEQEFQLRFEELKDLYLRASFPIERGGMGLRNIEFDEGSQKVLSDHVAH